MKVLTRIGAAVHVTALGVWAGALLMAGIAPAVIFPMMREMGVKAAAFEKYGGEHWRIVAGRAAHRIFAIVDLVQLVCASLVILSFILLATGGRVKRGGRALGWTMGLALSMAPLAYELFILSPRMDLNVRAYWDAAERGEMAAATTYQAAFEADHPTASRVYGGLACLVVVTTLAAAWPGKDTEMLSAVPSAAGGDARPTR